MKKYENCRLGFFERDNEKRNISYAPSTSLRGIQSSILNVLKSLNPKDQKKYNNTEMKSGRLFTTTTQHLIPAVVNITMPVKSRSLESNQTKIKN